MAGSVRAAVALALTGVLLAGCGLRRPAPEPPAPEPTPRPASVVPGPTPRPTSVVPRSALPFPAPGEGALPARQRAALQEVLDTYVAGDAGRGLTAAVVTARGGWSGAAGVDGDRRPLVATSTMCIGSATATFIGAEIVHLAAVHQLDLDQPASAYVDHPLLVREPTVRQLLTHTSGLPEFTTGPMIDAVLAGPNRIWTPDQALSFTALDPADPGGGFLYRDTDNVLLGRVIATVTGLSWQVAVRRDLFRGEYHRIAGQVVEAPSAPLAAPDRARGIRADGPFVPNRAVASALGAAGGMAADAPSLARWGYQLYGGFVLPPAQVLQMTTAHTPRYGLETEIDPAYRGSLPMVGHRGRSPGFAAALLVLPTRRTSVAVMMPTEIDPAPFASRLLTIVAP